VHRLAVCHGSSILIELLRYRTSVDNMHMCCTLIKCTNWEGDNMSYNHFVVQSWTKIKNVCCVRMIVVACWSEQPCIDVVETCHAQLDPGPIARKTLQYRRCLYSVDAIDKTLLIVVLESWRHTCRPMRQFKIAEITLKDHPRSSVTTWFNRGNTILE